MNTKAKQMMEKWSKRAARNYKIAEKYRVLYKESGCSEDYDIYRDYLYRGQLCGQAAADFEEMICD